MEKQIYYHDTDAGGVVYYGRYLNYLEEARTEYLQQRGLDLKLFRQKKFLYAVRQCNVSYESPARYGDIIVCDAKLAKITTARLIFEQEIRDKETGRLILKAEVTLVSLNEHFKTTPIPEDIKSLLV
ncbi:MAG: YbgC/FadM family acyl-CoA thioesterase [Candidatus Omnitrophica bacterium]|nr:YbgC/FadM family acyl-CoA thioesterase [Candidatus Omnitrophota bacterium]